MLVDAAAEGLFSGLEELGLCGGEEITGLVLNGLEVGRFDELRSLALSNELDAEHSRRMVSIFTRARFPRLRELNVQCPEDEEGLDYSDAEELAAQLKGKDGMGCVVLVINSIVRREPFVWPIRD